MVRMDDNQVRAILRSTRTIASVGVSANPARPSYGVAYYLQSQGYHVVPVNPTVSEALGEKAYPELTAVPEKIDVVQMFRRPEDTPPIVEQAIKVGAKVVWLQEATLPPEAVKMAEEAGLQVVMERCMMQEHRRLIGPGVVEWRRGQQ